MKFDGKTIINRINCEIPDGVVYGMVGSNGAGKSTLLRILSGVYKPESGYAEFDGQRVFDNSAVKENIAFVPDDLFFLSQSNLLRMASFYSSAYKNFNRQRFFDLCRELELDPKANLRTFSKGMKRQAAIILALSAMPKYLFLDETFDGLDPIVRMKVKKFIYNDVFDRKMTAILTSHSLRELEDTCDTLALFHKGGIVFESDIHALKTSLFKIQVAFRQEYGREKFDGINILSYDQNGTVASMIIRGDQEDVKARITVMDPLLLDILPLSLEEVFIFEMQAIGYTADELL